MPEAYIDQTIWQYSQSSGSLNQLTKPLIREHALTLVVNGENWLTFICSPTDLPALALGFLWNENVVSDLAEVKTFAISTDSSEIRVELTHPVVKPAHFHRTSTGVSPQSLRQTQTIPSDFHIPAEQVTGLFREFMDLQTLHDQVGGFHSAGLSDGSKVRLVVEDLGRHNCADKLDGLFLLQNKPFTPRALLLSGRISSEMVFKTLPLGIPLIVSRTSPTSLAVQIADQAGITVVGYLRSNQFEVYCHPERILV
ncbi:MAG: formate dehydrogenase accessory sulfurtransferase FdhD [Anaerolineaceae bacterium]